MKRSEINAAWRDAKAAFQRNGWALPPEPRVDVTDLGLGRFPECGLVLVNLCEEPEYCEKLMYAKRNQAVSVHAHKKKKEDIIARNGRLTFELYERHPRECAPGAAFTIARNGRMVEVRNGESFTIESGERITLVQGVYHAFWPESEECVIGEVSTANDDVGDNFFVDESIGRFPDIEEDEPAEVRLLSES